MKFTLSWLKKFLVTDNSLQEIVQGLNEIGLEVEEVIDRSSELSSFEVAHIIKTSPHPSADKLQICEVEATSGILQIVCGAFNARKDLKVVLAKSGSVIPNGNFKIKESEIRGIKSYGMLCSESELLVGENTSGIIELPSSAKVGEPFAQYYGLDDPVIHIAVTPNRADALSVYGIARDLAAKGLGKLRTLEVEEIKSDFNSDFSIEVNDINSCGFFAVRELKEFKNCASPDWLKKLLTSIGVGSISAIVDITNYISYTFGQPLHAYDKSKLTGNRLTIEILKSNTNFSALNKKQYELSEGSLIIRDSKNIQCLAGIIGSQESACDLTTTNIILEAAFYTPKIIAQQGRKHNIITDSRYKFERTVNSTFTLQALDIAANMIMSICGGKSSQVISQGAPSCVQRTIEFQIDFFRKIAGFEIKTEIICNILQSLGFKVEQAGAILKLIVPSWRSDISIKEDIVEEILRIYGYDKLTEVELPQINIERILPKEQRRYSDAKRILAGLGYTETLGWSFIDKNLSRYFAETKEELTIINPISSDLNYMRPSIIPNLLKAAAKNFARSVKDLAFFEVGPIFKGIEPTDEKVFASGIRAGFDNIKSAHLPQIREVDVFDIKSDLIELLNFMGLDLEKCIINQNYILPFYHPSRSAAIQQGNNIIGYFGQLHPSVLKHFGIEQNIYAFELDLIMIPYGKPKFGHRKELVSSDFQNVVRDFAFIVDKDQNVGEIISFVKNIDKKLVRSVELFDIYIGDKIAINTKSIALSVNIQADDRTLNEQELVDLSNIIINGVEQKFKSTLRK